MAKPSAKTNSGASARANSAEPAAKTNSAAEPSGPGLWFCNWKIWLEARRLLDETLAPLGLRAKEFWILAIAGKGDVSQHRMAELCGMDPSSLVPVLDDLERRGWVRRQRNPRDRRVQWVQRTPAGDELFERARPRAQRAEARQLSALSAVHQRQLVAAMRKLVSTSTTE